MKRLRRVVSLVLALTFVLITVGRTAIVANADDNYGTVVYDENGTKYVIKTYDYDDYRKVVTTNCESKDKIEIVVDNDYEELIITNYDYQGKNIFGFDKYKMEKTITEVPDDIDNYDDVTSQYTWQKRVYELWSMKNPFWYQKGVSGYGNEYLQIGCKASYRIKYWDLSSKKQDKCDKYVQAIKDCNKHWTCAAGKAIGTNSLFLICVAIAGCALTGGVAIGAVSAMFAGNGDAVREAYESYSAYSDANEYYAIIKYYGYEI